MISYITKILRFNSVKLTPLSVSKEKRNSETEINIFKKVLEPPPSDVLFAWFLFRKESLTEPKI